MTGRTPFFLSTIILASLSSGFSDEPKNERRELTDDPQSDHGHIRWTSQAKLQNGIWTYERFVENLDSKRARVTWEHVHWGPTWIEPKEQMMVGRLKWSVEPTIDYGVIRLYGGRAPGETVRDTQIWKPMASPGEKKTESFLSAAATFAVEYKNKSYPLDITGDSKITKDEKPYQVLHSLTLKSRNDERLPDEVRIRWDSITCPEFLQQNDGALLRLDRQRTFHNEISTDRRPVFRSQTIRFQTAEGDTLATAELPALAPPPKNSENPR
jgi:hypothetical protein